MTVPYTGTPGPGWFPAPDGSGRLQWWDGNTWPGHFSYPPRPGPSAARPQISPQTQVYNPFIWLVVVLPLVPIAFLLAWNPVIRLTYLGSQHVRMLDPLPFFTPAYFLLVASGGLTFAATAVLAYLDWQKLRREGIVRPFHWVWVFISATVYVLGRSVIVHQAAPRRGLAPIWAMTVLTVVSLIAVSIRISPIILMVSATIPT